MPHTIFFDDFHFQSMEKNLIYFMFYLEVFPEIPFEYLVHHGTIVIHY